MEIFEQIFEQALEYIIISLEVIGVIVVVWGAIETIFIFFFHGLNHKHVLRIERLMLSMGENMVLGLDFFLASDIIATVRTPNFSSLGQLGALVIIRTVLSYFLQREIKSQKKFLKLK